MLSNNSKLNYKQHLIAIFFYSILFGIFYFQLFSVFSSALITDGNHLDILQVYWNTWNFSERVLNLQNPFYTTSLLFPRGHSLVMHANTSYFGFLNLFFRNPIVAINIGIISQFVFGAYFAFRLSSLFIKEFKHQLFIGALFVFNFYILNKSSIHYNLILLSLCPLIIYFLIKAFDVKDRKLKLNYKYLYIGFLLLTVNFFFDYYSIFYALSFIILYIIYYLYAEAWLNKFNYRKGILLIAIFLVSHIIIRLLRISGFDEKGAIWSASDFRTFVMPAFDSIYPSFLKIVPIDFYENSLFLGYSLIIGLLIVFFIKTERNRNLNFLFFAIICYVLVTSPIIKFGNKDWFYFPTAIIHFIPFVNNVRSPSRFIEMLFFVIPIFILLKVEVIKNKKVYHGILVNLFFGLFLLEGYCFSKEVIHYTNNRQLTYKSVYANNYFILGLTSDKIIAEQAEVNAIIPKGFSVLSIPFGIRDGFEDFGFFDERIYVYQYYNKLKTTSGYLSRLNKETWEQYRNDEFYKQLVNAQKDSIGIKLTSAQVQSFIKLNKINAVLIDKEYLNSKLELTKFLDTVFPKENYNWVICNKFIIIKLTGI